MKNPSEKTRSRILRAALIIPLIMAGHKNYRFCSHHRAHVLKKPAFFIFKIMEKLVFIIALMIFIAWIDPYRDEVKKGNEEFHRKNFEKARDHYREAEKYAPGRTEKNKLRFNRGDVRYMNADYEGAIDDFKAAVRSEDRTVQKKAIFNEGNAHLKKGETAEAVRSYIEALKIDPDFGPAKKNLEYILENREQDKNTGKKEGSDGSENQKENEKRGQKDKDPRNSRESEKPGKPELKNKGNMSREQLLNIMKSMQRKPVRRDRGTGEDERVPEKSW